MTNPSKPTIANGAITGTTNNTPPVRPDRQVVSLFSGGMGLDLGLHQAGLHTAVAQEMNKHACATIANNGINLVPGDLKKLVASDSECNFLLGPAGLKKGEAFVLAGGPPCQAFSVAGKQLGLEDARGQLLFTYLDVLEAVQPRFAVMENVKGLRRFKSKEGDFVIDLFRERLADIGYSSVYSVLTASDYGVPQRRERLVLIASRDDEPIHLPEPTHHKAGVGLPQWLTLRDAIGDLGPLSPGAYKAFNEKQARVMSHIGEGECWLALYKHRDAAIAAGDTESAEFFEAMGREFMGVVWNRDYTGSTSYWRRLAWDRPAPTLTTSPLQRGSFFAHPSEQRPLSVQEYARVQGFPDDWVLAGGVADQYKQIGNAVPVGLGAAVGHALVTVADSVDRGEPVALREDCRPNYMKGK